MDAGTAADGRYISLARIGKPRGIAGEFYLRPLAEDLERFFDLRKVYMVRRNIRAAMEVESFRIVSGKPVMKLQGIDTPEDAQSWVNGYLEIDADDRVELPEGKYFQDDLIGLTVVNEEGVKLGTIEGVMEMPANDVYVCRTPNGGEVLLPAIADLIRSIDLKARTMTIGPFPGLFE